MTKATHRATGTPLYRVWQNMKKRCLNPSATHFHQYGGRGITFDPSWADFSGFKQWAEANGYEPRLTLERKDVDGNYCPENCCWIEAKLQARNRTDTIWLEYEGERKSLAEWAEIKGFTYTTLKNRLLNYGFPPERMFEPLIRGCPAWNKKREPRPRKDAIWIEVDGERKLLSDCAKSTGLSLGLLHQRYFKGVRGPDLFLPSDKGRRRKK